MKISAYMMPAQATNVAQWHDDKAATAYQKGEFDVYERHAKILRLLRNRANQPTMTQRIISAERSERGD